MKTNIGIIFADEMEYKPFKEKALSLNAREEKLHKLNSLSFSLSRGEDEIFVTAVECGIGKVNAAFAATCLILEKGVQIVLNAGLSGAVSGVRRGDIVAGESFLECDFDLTAIGYPLAKKPDGDETLHTADSDLLEKALSLGEIKRGKLGTGDLFLTDPEKKSLFKKLFDLCAFDMETAAIAAVCSKCDVPFLSLRKISDDADDSSAEDYREMNEKAESHLSDILFRLFEII